MYKLIMPVETCPACDQEVCLCYREYDEDKFANMWAEGCDNMELIMYLDADGNEIPF